MTLPRPELPSDVARCHAVIEQLHAELQRATEQIAAWNSAAVETRDVAARIAHRAADNALLKRSLFGSRRERYTDDPAQALLFTVTAQDTPAADD